MRFITFCQKQKNKRLHAFQVSLKYHGDRVFTFKFNTYAKAFILPHQDFVSSLCEQG